MPIDAAPRRLCRGASARPASARRRVARPGQGPRALGEPRGRPPERHRGRAGRAGRCSRRSSCRFLPARAARCAAAHAPPPHPVRSRRLRARPPGRSGLACGLRHRQPIRVCLGQRRRRGKGLGHLADRLRQAAGRELATSRPARVRAPATETCWPSTARTASSWESTWPGTRRPGAALTSGPISSSWPRTRARRTGRRQGPAARGQRWVAGPRSRRSESQKLAWT